jgi:hypothetical protein
MGKPWSLFGQREILESARQCLPAVGRPVPGNPRRKRRDFALRDNLHQGVFVNQPARSDPR